MSGPGPLGPRLRGLYAITPARLCREPARLYPAVEAALAGGAALLQYRDKENGPAARLAMALQLQALCRRQGAALVINDDVELAARIGAGVHLGLADASPRDARHRLGAQALIGVTCGSSLQRAAEAQAAGASYAGFGRFFPSRTKPDAPEAPLAVLREAHRRLGIPVCAIGGITPDNVAEVVAAGADLIAAVEGVFGAEDIEAAARSMANLIKLTPAPDPSA